MSVAVRINVKSGVYIRDPQDTKIGKKIIKYGIILIDELGIEEFTFKKLAQRMDSTEASIYRYFKNKNLLLLYLLTYYWEWMRFRIDFNAMNVEDPERRLRIVVKTIVDTIRLSTPAEYIERDALHRIVITEGSKALHVKQVDEENEKGFFAIYKALNRKIAAIIQAVNPDFPYPVAFANTLLQMGNNHLFFATHLPSLTEVSAEKDGSVEVGLERLMNCLVNMIKNYTK